MVEYAKQIAPIDGDEPREWVIKLDRLIETKSRSWIKRVHHWKIK